MVLEFEDTKTAVMVRDLKINRDPKSVIGCLKTDKGKIILEMTEDLRGVVELLPDQ